MPSDATILTAFGLALAALGAVLAAKLILWQPVQKSWCVILYLVSRDTNTGFSWADLENQTPDNLDAKLDQVVGTLDALPCNDLLTYLKALIWGVQTSPGSVDWNDVHVVYRAVWNLKPPRLPNKPVTRARIVTWHPGTPPKPDDSMFDDPTAQPPLDDRDGFFKWAYTNCPADHYAVFFWGHSIGPGGLFELDKSVSFPPPPSSSASVFPASLKQLEQTLRDLMVDRLSGHGGGAGTGPDQQPPGGPKAEVVFFQDCWMSTLETAVELKDVARYIVGSQGPVPIGYQYDTLSRKFIKPEGPTWPYELIIQQLLGNPVTFAHSALDTLQGFYQGAVENLLPSDVVAFSLLDLGAGDEVKKHLVPALQLLVKALDPLSCVDRKPLLAESQIVKFDNPITMAELRAGEWALADVAKLCHTLDAAGFPSANKLLAQVLPAPGAYSLVAKLFEAPDKPLLGFAGVSVLVIPGKVSPPGDRFIADQIDRTFYDQLHFVTETTTNGVAGNWGCYAFEQKNGCKPCKPLMQ